MTHEVSSTSVEFLNGSPSVSYSRIYKCFKEDGNGLLFRLVDEEQQKWAFYNDTAETVMKVTAVFGEGTHVAPLGRTCFKNIPNPSGTTGYPYSTEATLSIDPGCTEWFIEGNCNGFSMSFHSEAAPVRDVTFEGKGPSMHYDRIYKCFKNNGNGLLFRIVDERRKQWAFYNDTKNYVMKVTVEFSDSKEIHPLGQTECQGAPASNPNGVVYQLDIAPGATEPFIEGTAENYCLSFSADPVNNDKPIDSDNACYENEGPDYRIVSGDCHVYKCFKNNGNGLLFRLVDERREQWAFYNDTKDYIMKATVRFPKSEHFTPSADASASTDPEDRDITIVTMDIPPTTTRVFLTGLPKNFVVGFSAESANKMQPEQHPEYVLSGPDPSVMDYVDVYRCFKDRGNGLLFRLVSGDGNHWGFYNDTEDTTITARVAFDEESAVSAHGSTRMEKDPQMGTVYVLEVPPRATMQFVGGSIGGFSSSFSAVKKAVPV